MALTASGIYEVNPGGSDTLNGGLFDPSQTAGMFTTGSATSATGAAPVFSDVNYAFVAGDAGHWVYIASGTNWTPGWYKIASVASGNATLNATIGQAEVRPTALPPTPSTVLGCATTASPTNATWTIDYSRSTAAQFAYTDLVSAGTGLTVSSAAFPFGKQQVGNCVVVTGGTNFNTGRYVIASIGALNVATVIGAGNITTGAGASGTGGLGGALKTTGACIASKIAGTDVCILTGTQTLTTSTPGAAGPTNDTVGGVSGSPSVWEGYGTVRGDKGTPPVISAGAVTSITIMNLSANATESFNLSYDGNSGSTNSGVTISSNRARLGWIKVANCTVNGVFVNGAECVIWRIEATTCSGTGAINLGSGACHAIFLFAHDNTTTGVIGTGTGQAVNYSGSWNNTTGSADGFQLTGGGIIANSWTYANARHGFNIGQRVWLVVNCIAEGHSAASACGFTCTSGVVSSATLMNCGGFNNNSHINLTNIPAPAISFATFTVSPFTNAAGADFSLNTAAGGGALARGAGYPGILPAGGTGYLDMGALQHPDPSVARVVVGGGAVNRAGTY